VSNLAKAVYERTEAAKKLAKKELPNENAIDFVN
jgi:hypothetical protein